MARQKAFTGYYDSEGGELLEVKLTDEFADESALIRTDVLDDAVGVIRGLLEKAGEGYYGEGGQLEQTVRKALRARKPGAKNEPA